VDLLDIVRRLVRVGDAVEEVLDEATPSGKLCVRELFS
jgi:hypothetical protein